MVAVSRRVTLNPTVYCEVAAESASEAVELVRSQEKDFVLDERHFVEEAIIMIKDDNQLAQAKSTLKSAGPASQYHSEAECKLCAKTNRENRKNNS